MKSISKLKDEARKYEQREEWEKAIQAYLQVLKTADEEEAEVELPLYNRLGDLCVRLGRPEEAVRHYEQAADRYAEAGLYNNAIALCNKALRYNRDRLELIRKLGQFSALQGFITDARRYFLDYAERQFNVGRVDDALSALEDFANVSDDADVREMLGRRMAAYGRIGDALNELQRAYAMRVRDGDTQKAEALRAEIQALDPSGRAVAPPAGEPARHAAPHVEELPGFDEPETFEVATFDDPGTAAVEGLEPTGVDEGLDAGSIEITGFDHEPASPLDVSSATIEGLETGTVDFDAVDAPAAEDIGLMREESSFGDMFPEESPDAGFDLPLLDDDSAEDATPVAPPLIENVHAPIDLGTDFSFDLGGFGTTAAPEPIAPESDFELPSAGAGADDDGIDLPALDDSDLDLPTLDADAGFELPSLEADTALDLPTLEADPGFELPSLEADTALDLPTLDETDGLAGLPTLEDDAGLDLPTLDEPGTAPDLPLLGDDDDTALPLLGDDQPFEQTFDGPTVEDAPAVWQPEPGPEFELPAFEPEPQGYEPEPPAFGTAAEPAPWDAEPDEAVAFDSPAAESPADLPELAEPADFEVPSSDPDRADAAPPTFGMETVTGTEARVEIPAIELPTWDMEPAVADAPVEEATAEAPAAPDVAAVDDLLDLPPRVFDEPAEPDTDFEPASSDDWLSELTEEADAGAAIGEPEAFEDEQPVVPQVEDVRAIEAQARSAAKEMAASAPVPVPEDGYIDLGALITEDDEDEGTRFRIQETAPTGDEDRDFAELLSQFKSKVHEHLPTEDAAAHYDLGLAFKEMGLLDEAIGEFQIALRAGHMRLRVYEELGQCFLMKEQYNIAEKVLTRALEMKFDDELELLGVYYHLGRAYEALGRRDQARDAYERVLGMDINFEDVTARLARL